MAFPQLMDNWLGQVMPRENFAKHRELVLLLCEELDWIVNQKKSELISQQVFAFVGTHYNLISFNAHPTLENWVKVSKLPILSPTVKWHSLGSSRANVVWSHWVAATSDLYSETFEVRLDWPLDPVMGSSKHRGSCASGLLVGAQPGAIQSASR